MLLSQSSTPPYHSVSTTDELADDGLILRGHTEVCKEVAETGRCIAYKARGYNLFPVLTPLTLYW